MIGLSLVVSCVFLLSAGSIAFLYPIMALVGWFFGGYQVYPWSMIPDSVTDGQARTGLSLEGAFNGWFTTQQKMGIAFGPLVFGALLSLAGYQQAYYQDGVQIFPRADRAGNPDDPAVFIAFACRGVPALSADHCAA